MANTKTFHLPDLGEGLPDATIVELPNLNHLFQACKTGAPSEYAQIEETFNPDALKVVGDWIVDQATRR